MQTHHFFDIMFEDENGIEKPADREYLINLPDHDMSSPMERQEFLSIMMDTLVATSGLNVSSFRSESVRLNTVGDY